MTVPRMTTSTSGPACPRVLALLAVAAAALAGCGGDTTAGADPTSSAAASTAPTNATADSAALTVTDPWVKATQDTMTAAFGTLTNSTDAEIHIVSATTLVSERAELHEVVTEDGAAMMRQKQDGFRVPADGELELTPGGDHVMIMNLTEPVTAGDQVEVTLTAEDGQTYTFSALAKPFTGANESYHSQDGSTMSSPPVSADTDS